ncbi:hypothetical protein NCG97_00605 [Streptomyces lydicamycinicus]|uniref:hypothetical protein n=1 Tax=Streptomyces lydicamycinicus TaxID=1546107 RepID=UPI002035EB99|nr:hypothetical protein [Streptomyces lydicamycinicus]URZ99513.1 hypothetical protein NCG97_00605 [Streptomyces lydicamycinicus]
MVSAFDLYYEERHGCLAAAGARQQRKCVEGRARLNDAGPDEVARIVALYAELLKGLDVSGPPAEA